METEHVPSGSSHLVSQASPWGPSSGSGFARLTGTSPHIIEHAGITRTGMLITSISSLVPNVPLYRILTSHYSA